MCRFAKSRRVGSCDPVPVKSISYSKKEMVSTKSESKREYSFHCCLFQAHLGHVDNTAFHNFEQRVLDTFTRHVATDTDVATRFANLVALVNVNNASLTALHILSTFQVQFEQNAFHVFPHVAGLGQAGGVGNDQWNVNEASERFDQERFTGTLKNGRKEVKKKHKM